MKTDYGLRPNEQQETDLFPKLVRKQIDALDDAEQSYFRNNPAEIGKNPKIAKAAMIEKVVFRICDLRMQKRTWKEVHDVLLSEFGLKVSTSTLHRWAEKALDA